MPRQRLSSKWALWLTIALLLGAAVVLAACGGAQPPETPTPPPEVECPEVECPEVTYPEPVVAEVPFEDLWASSGHNDVEAEAFNHWNEDDPAEVSASCAKCHSTPGYLDFLGVDGSAAGTVDDAAEIGTTITCIACHNEATLVMDSVVFPSGVEVTGLGDESRCMQCHQGRESAVSVNNAIAELGLADDDTSSEELGFRNIHYFAAGATQFGGVTMGGYQYDGKTYDAKFAHVEGIDTCIDCHDPHTLEVKVAVCSACHTDVASKEDLKDLRWKGSEIDYDGDDDIDEGVYYEIKGLQEILYGAIQAYASAAGTPIIYDAGAHPYFFIDTNGNSEADPDEANRDNAYNAWTPRLLRAAYNYQVSVKDPGAFAHGGKYIIQLLYDSTEDLDASLVAGLHRIDAGHFAGSEEAFRHWDEDGKVRSTCARCHSATGLPTLLKEGTNVSEPLSNGFLCTTCHNDLATFSRYEVTTVAFPSGAKLDTGNPDSNLCLNCHQGRESAVSVDKAIAGLAKEIAAAAEKAAELGEEVEITELGDDTATEDLGFLNVHYFAAGATLFGTEAKGAYEYEGQTYNGRFAHVDGYASCAQCHDAHALEPKDEACGTCHTGIEEPEDIRMDTTDFDGDGNTTEGIAGEIKTFREALYSATKDYAANVAGAPIVYAQSYPYFVVDTNGNGEPDRDEVSRDNSYSTWTPRLLRAAYNLQYVTKDTGAFVHNGKYVIQILYDSLEDLGGDTTGMVRPEPESE
jgi:hypothetical protein